MDHLSAIPSDTFTLAVAPTGSLSLAQRKAVASHYAMNARAIDDQMAFAEPGTTLVRVFDEEAARFELQGASIRLPGWSVTIDADQERTSDTSGLGIG
jgi:hypothetical protein